MTLQRRKISYQALVSVAVEVSRAVNTSHIFRTEELSSKTGGVVTSSDADSSHPCNLEELIG